MLKKLCATLLIASLPSIALAERDLDDVRSDTIDKNEWRLSKNDKRHNIKAYVKNEEGKAIRSFRVEALFDAPIEVIARIQGDVDSYMRWQFGALEVKLLKKVSDREFIYYLVHDAPIGTPDRDVILRTTIEPMTAKKPYIGVKVVALPDYLPDRPPYVRMEAENYSVKISPVGKDQTLLEAEGFIDPGGVAPSWAVNFAQGKGPYSNMMGMKRLAADPKIRDAKGPLPFTFFE
ncbi:START domain-containing protein [Agitococcus lubricus]|uniref:START domain-containing protein n=1 Tax=Agitococcus lubricus TaxID=1077255 RepID=A0A2T5IVL7_9GAMM|nr:START domain-containing protein [Agitococcus lubricus]PTQ87934.1 START domain-containing protein [Agitococcus lubricus]